VDEAVKIKLATTAKKFDWENGISLPFCQFVRPAFRNCWHPIDRNFKNRLSISGGVTQVPAVSNVERSTRIISKENGARTGARSGGRALFQRTLARSASGRSY
jgi:hypothetical protein